MNDDAVMKWLCNCKEEYEVNKGGYKIDKGDDVNSSR